MNKLEEKLKSKLCNKLPVEFKKKLLDALRGDQYKFCTGSLHEIEDGQHRYCTLGVASMVAGAHPRQDKAYPASRKVPYILRGENKITEKIAEMNDISGGFEETADWIEKNL